MSTTIDRSNNNDDDKPSLSVEKQFTHTIFCQHIQKIDLASAKELLEELHMLYLGQQDLMVKIAKQDFNGLL